MADPVAPAIPEDLLARIRFAISDPAAFFQRGDGFKEPVPAWSARAVEHVLTEWLADRVMVDPPKPDGTDNEGDPLWELGAGEVVIAYCDAGGHPMIRLPDGDDVAPEWAEMYAAVLLAAVRDSRRLADAGTVRICPKCGLDVEALPRGRACDECVAAYVPPPTVQHPSHPIHWVGDGRG